MRHFAWEIVALLFLGMVSSSAPADAPVVLTFADLVDHPERWPDQVSMKNTLQFTDGSSLAAGQKMKLVGLDSGGVQVGTETGSTNFGVSADDTDVVAAANAQWSKLNADQRNLSLSVIQSDASLWPLTLKTKDVIKFSGGTSLPTGAEVNFLHFHPGRRTTWSFRSANWF